MDRRIVVRNIRFAAGRVRKEISDNAQSAYGRGLANEGYAGGYQQALADVLLMLESDTMPNTRGYWREDKQATPESGNQGAGK